MGFRLPGLQPDSESIWTNGRNPCWQAWGVIEGVSATKSMLQVMEELKR